MPKKKGKIGETKRGHGQRNGGEKAGSTESYGSKVYGASVSVNSVAVPDVMQGRPSVRCGPYHEQQRTRDSTWRNPETESGEITPHLYSWPKIAAGLFTSILRARPASRRVTHHTNPNSLFQGQNWENAPTADQTQEVNSTGEGTLWKNNNVALPQRLDSVDVLPTNNSRASCPHDLGHLLNRLAPNCLGSAQTPEPSLWTLNNVSISDSAFHSNRSTYNTRSSKQAILEGRALKQWKTPTSHHFVLTDELALSLLDTAVSAISPVVCEIQAWAFRTKCFWFRRIGSWLRRDPKWNYWAEKDS